MTHPRLSVSALSSVRWSFDEDLACWRELGVGWAGLMDAKLGEDAGVRFAALAEAGIRASTVVVPRFDLGEPASWPATRQVLRRWTDTVKDTGYPGPLELELIGPLGDREGYAPLIRRGVAAAEAMLGAAGL